MVIISNVIWVALYKIKSKFPILDIWLLPVYDRGEVGLDAVSKRCKIVTEMGKFFVWNTCLIYENFFKNIGLYSWGLYSFVYIGGIGALSTSSWIRSLKETK